MTQVQPGQIVSIHYTGKFEDGTVFDSSEGRDPLEFVAGSEQLIQGVREAVLDMSTGQRKTVTIPPEQGYGQRNEGAQYRVPRENLPEEVKTGDQLSAELQGKRVAFWVAELGDESALLDANHPLAGRTLVFDIEVVDVRSESA